MMHVDVFFFGNCQASRMAQLYGAFTPGPQRKSNMFRSITPHFGNYVEEESKQALETAAIAVVQLVTSDYIFNRDAVLDMRGGKPTIFLPYVYLRGFRPLEKLSSKGVPRIDGAEIFLAEIDRVGHANRAVLGLMQGAVDMQNKSRFEASLDELRRREAMGTDIQIADYIAQTYQDHMPCFSINHPTPHVLFAMYAQVAKLAGFAPLPEKLSPYDLGRAALPAGNGGLTPYCVDALGLSYGAEPHWFSATHKNAQDLARRWTKETSA